MTEPMQLCRCGCRTSVQSGVYAPGHHVRAAFAFCACDCGARVHTSRARFIPHHHLRLLVPEPPAVTTSVCAWSGGGKPFPHAAHDQRTYCCRAHRARANFEGRRPKEPFNRFVYDRWNASGLSVRAFGLEHAIPDRTMRSIFAGKRPRQGTVDLAVAAWGTAVPLPQETETDRRSKAADAMRNDRVAARAADPEAARRSDREAAKKRSAAAGWKMPPEAVEKSVEGKRRTGALERAATNLKAVGAQQRTRALRVLNGHRRRRPDVLPTKDEIGRWEVAAAVALGFKSASEVHAIWHPILERIGWQPKGGRKRTATQPRHDLIRSMQRSLGLGPFDAMPRGFWPDVAKKANRDIGEKEPGYEGQNRYWHDHLPGCIECQRERIKMPTKT
jgi:hypothetical protein